MAAAVEEALKTAALAEAENAVKAREAAGMERLTQGGALWLQLGDTSCSAHPVRFWVSFQY